MRIAIGGQAKPFASFMPIVAILSVSSLLCQDINSARSGARVPDLAGHRADAKPR